MIGARLAKACALFAVLTWGMVSTAAPKRIAIADAADDPAVAIRLRAELTAAGFSVVDVAVWPAEASSHAVYRMLAPSDVQGAIRVSRNVIDVWMVDSDNETLVHREAIPTGASDLTTAVRAVEIVRAELTRKPRVPPRTSIRNEPKVIAPPRPAQRRTARSWSIDFGVGASGSPGGTTLEPAFVFGATWWPFDHAGFGALVVGSPSPSVVEALEGRAHIWTGMGGGGVALTPTDPHEAWRVRVEAGGAACWLHMRGFAKPSYTSGSATVFAAAPYMRVGIAWQLTDEVGVQLGVIGAVALPRPVVSFAGREVATWGRPVIVGTGGTDLSF